MIRAENIDVIGLEAALRGMRNPKNSWDRSDSHWCDEDMGKDCPEEDCHNESYYCIGENDMTLAKRLIKGGTEHRKFLRMIHIQMDVVAPLYWWKEADTYKVGTVSNSCSTMHKLASKPIVLEDFSFDNGLHEGGVMALSNAFVTSCEEMRKMYLETKDKEIWRFLIQLLPCSYNQRRTLDFNYEVALNILHQRENHKLDEWHTFCDILRDLPYMKAFEGSEEES